MNRDCTSQPDCDSVMSRLSSCGGVDTVLSDSVPLAMAYVRMQAFDRMYPPETALRQGTLYPELDLPFCGRTVGGKNAQ